MGSLIFPLYPFREYHYSFHFWLLVSCTIYHQSNRRIFGKEISSESNLKYSINSGNPFWIDIYGIVYILPILINQSTSLLIQPKVCIGKCKVFRRSYRKTTRYIVIQSTIQQLNLPCGYSSKIFLTVTNSLVVWCQRHTLFILVMRHRYFGILWLMGKLLPMLERTNQKMTGGILPSSESQPTVSRYISGFIDALTIGTLALLLQFHRIWSMPWSLPFSALATPLPIGPTIGLIHGGYLCLHGLTDDQSGIFMLDRPTDWRKYPYPLIVGGWWRCIPHNFYHGPLLLYPVASVCDWDGCGHSSLFGSVKRSWNFSRPCNMENHKRQRNSASKTSLESLINQQNKREVKWVTIPFWAWPKRRTKRIKRLAVLSCHGRAMEL